MKKLILIVLLTYFIYPIIAQHQISIELKTDNHGNETTWELKNIFTNFIIASGGPYESNNSTIQNINPIEVDGTGCYSFIIYDSGGNGICCSNGNGYVKLYYDNILSNESTNFDAQFQIINIGNTCVQNEIELTKITSEKYSELNEDITIRGVVRNIGTTPLSSFDIKYKINDGEYVETQTIECSETNINQTTTFTHNTKFQSTEYDIYNITVEASNPNGIEDNTSNNIRIHQIVVNQNSVPRKVLLEHFTTERCSSCPPATELLNELLSSRPDVIWIAHHAGYYSDQYTIPESTSLLSFYNTTETYSPAIMLDREAIIPFEDPSPIFSPDNITTELIIDKKRFTGAYINIDMNIDYNAYNRKLILNVSGEVIGNIIENDLNISVFITEDGLRSYHQAGSMGMYIHNNVIRDVISSSYQGDNNIITNTNIGSTFNKTYEYNINSNWVVENLNIIAFVNNWDSDDSSNRNVLNACKKPLIPNNVYIDNFDVDNISIWPNPATNVININNAKGANISILNPTGEEVILKNNISNHQVIDISSLNEGAYILVINNKEDIITQKLIIIR